MQSEQIRARVFRIYAHLFIAGWALRAEGEKHCPMAVANNPVSFEKSRYR